MIRPALVLLALLAAPSAAQEDLLAFLEDKETIEASLDADLNADGVPDRAYVAVHDYKRELRVVTSYRNETDFGENPVQVLALDPYPLADAELSLTEGKGGAVLVFTELTGGTTAVFSTHRFRWDTKLQAMRLIGLDATLYSRTFAHGAKKVSWNLLTGAKVTQDLPLHKGAGDQAHDPGPEKRTIKSSPPLRLEQSPNGADALGWPGEQ